VLGIFPNALAPKIFVEMSSAVVADTKSVSFYKQQRGAGNNKLQIKHKNTNKKIEMLLE